MPASYFTRFFDRSFDWATTSGLRVLLRQWPCSACRLC